MTASLTILDRVMLCKILPTEGSIADMRTYLAIAKMCELTADEQSQWIDKKSGGIKLGCDEPATVKDFEFSDDQNNVVVERLKLLDQSHHINQHMLGLVAVFLEDAQ